MDNSNWSWYAQSSSTFYTSGYIQKFNSKTKQYPVNNDGFKTTDFINKDNVGPNGINKYGIALSDPKNNINLADFSITCDSKSDFIYTTPQFRYTYNIAFDFEYFDDKNTIAFASYNNLVQYISYTKKQRNKVSLKLEDIFIHKFGHSDIRINDTQQQTMIQDGYSIGYKYQLNINNKLVDVQVRGNMNFNSMSPQFVININSTFESHCNIKVQTNDPYFTDNTKRVKIEKHYNHTIIINNNKPVEESVQDQSDQVKEELYKMSQFIDWRLLPKRFAIEDWTNTKVDDILNRYLDIADYIHNKRDNIIVANQYISLIENDGIIWYNNKVYSGYLTFSIIVSNDDCPLYTEENNINITNMDNQYIITQSSISIKNAYNSFSYELQITGYDTTLPTIKLIIKEYSKEKIILDLKSDLPFECLAHKNDHYISKPIELNHSIMTVDIS